MRDARTICRQLRTLVLAIVACLTLAAGPASAQVEIAPPYNMAVTAGNMTITPALGFSTVAITVVGAPAGGSVVFTPAAEAAPPGCAGTRATAPSTTCPASAMANALTITGAVVQVDVRGVETAQMTINGGPNTDAISVQGPAAPADFVGRLDVFTGPGGDDLTVRGNVGQVHDTSGADSEPDRYIVESPAITGELRPGGGDDNVTTDAPALTLDGGGGNDTLTAPVRCSAAPATTCSSRRPARRRRPAGRTTRPASTA